MDHQIKIKSCWTDALSDQVKNDYLSIANTVFGVFVTEDYYKAKYEDNIYGASLITVIYVDNQPAGTDVMWRNDLGGVKAYQTVDTCVLEKYRGMGLFKKTTRFELESLGEDTLVYGFPNVNSFPGYMKMGWRVKRLYKAPRFPLQNTWACDFIESDYAQWWLKSQVGIECICKNNKYYLIRKKKNGSAATLLGQVAPTAAAHFPASESVCLLWNFETKSSIYNKNKSIPLVCNQPAMEIPYWKIDAI